jgi:hypothetical protein
MDETWVPAAEYEGLYEVSSLGRVKSLLPSKRFSAPGHILKPKRVGLGYVGVNLYKDGRGSTVSIHKLVMRSFVGEAPPGMNVNHKDGIKKNNGLSNLEYVTFSSNSMHAFVTGLLPQAPTYKGEENGNASITESQAVEIAVRLHGGERPCDIAKDMGVSRYPVHDIKARRKWKYLFAPSGPLAHLPPLPRPQVAQS